jgi:hypothetical protein
MWKGTSTSGVEIEGYIGKKTTAYAIYDKGSK